MFKDHYVRKFKQIIYEEEENTHIIVYIRRKHLINDENFK